MDSFFSLFDPSDSQPKPPSNKKKRPKPEEDNAKKKPDAQKGRRRGRRSQGKHESLPEESSFLCEPQLSGEMLVHENYIDSYIITKPDPNANTDPENRPKRRNSGRKTRRKKKVSPAKDILPANAWSTNIKDTNSPANLTNNNNTSVENKTTNLNNQLTKSKNCNDTIGKNVNDLSDFKKTKRKNSLDHYDDDAFENKVYNVIEGLEKVSLKDDMYLSGDFNTEDLQNDCFYSSDDLDESFDDTTSEPEDSDEESFGSLPPEPRFGNVEYKLQLVNPCERRFQHLVTQLKWRLVSGGGSAVYVVGVRDCGALRGLRARALRASLHCLRRMANALDATLSHVTARRVAPHRAVAEVYIRKLADTQQSVELRVAVLGANEAGKSTLIGVLTQGELDNGRGSARLNMFRHLHEVKSGRTSSLSHEILGFDAQGNVVNYGCSELMTAERIGERSAKLVSFLDLAGHTKYQRTTLHGLSGYCPHYAMLVISATAGITPITEEHLALLSALHLPYFAVISKCDIAGPALPHLLTSLGELLTPAHKKPVLITDENAARSFVGPQPLILDSIATDFKDDDEPSTMEQIPVFPVSSVRGLGLNALHAYLLALQPEQPHTDTSPHDSVEFQIDEVFHVGDSVGPVVGGLLAKGRLCESDEVIIGPLEHGEFIPVTVSSVYRNRCPHRSVKAGHAASLGLRPQAPVSPRPGMVLLSRPKGPPAATRPSFGGCSPGTCKRKIQITDLIQKRADTAKERKQLRKKNKNLLQDVEIVEKQLTKDEIIQTANLYESDKDSNTKDHIKDRDDNVYASEKDSNIKDHVNERDSNIYDSDEDSNTKCLAKDRDSTIYESDNNTEDHVNDRNTNIFAFDKDSNTKDRAKERDSSIYASNKDGIIKDGVNERDSNIYASDKHGIIKDGVNDRDSNIYASDKDGIIKDGVNDRDSNIYASDMDSIIKDIVKERDSTSDSEKSDVDLKEGKEIENECSCANQVYLEDPNDPRGCIYFQASVHVLRHPTAICPGFQCTVHVGNVRQTAIIEGIMSHKSELRAGEVASVVFRFVRCPEYLVCGRRLLLTAGLATRAIGTITQIFPYVP